MAGFSMGTVVKVSEALTVEDLLGCEAIPFRCCFKSSMKA